MAVTKAKLFNTEQKRLAELAKALSHPARVAILELLADGNTCVCGDITDELPLAQSTISQHLKALKKSGLIRGDVDGVRICYCLNKETIEELEGLMGPFVRTLKISTRQNCC